MKRAMNVRLTTLVGILVLGTSGVTHAAAEFHNFGGGFAPGRPGLRKAVAPADQPQYSSIIHFPKDNAGKEVELTTQPIVGDAVKTKISAEALEGLSAQVEVTSQIRGELQDCKLDQDPVAKRLAERLDTFHKLVDEALRGVKEKDTNVVKPKTTDIRELIAAIDDIQALLASRQGKLAKGKEFATEREEKLAKFLDDSLKLFLGEKITPADEKAKFGYAARIADDGFRTETQKTMDATKEFLETADANVCLLGVPAPRVEREEARAPEVAQVEKPKEKEELPMQPAPAPKPPEKVDYTKMFGDFLARFDQKKQQQDAMAQQQQAQLVKDAIKGLEEQQKQVLAEQERQAQIAKMDDEKRAQALKNDLDKLKAMANKDDKNQKQTPPPAPPAVAASPGGGGSPMPQQGGMDPNQMGQQQDPNAGQNSMWQQMMAMMGMGQQNQSPVQQPQVFQMGPSRAWDDIYNSRSNRLGAIAPLPDGTQGAIQAQNALLNEIRMGQMGGMGGVPNAYGNPGMYGPQQQLPLSQRFGQVRSTGRAGVAGTQFNGISGTNLLATGRTRTVPVELGGSGI